MNVSNRFLDGDNVAPRTSAQAKALIGKRIRYLRGVDIDKSGRNYFFPRVAQVTDAHGRNMEVDGVFYSLASFVEVQIVGEESAA